MLASVLRPLVVAGLLLSAVPPASAAPEAEAPAGKPIGLAEALASAVQQNPGLKTASIDIEIANARIRQAQGVTDFQVDLGATYFRQRQEAIPDAIFQQLETDTLGLSGGLSKGLSTGGRVGLKLEHNYNKALNRFTGEDMGVMFEQDQSTTQHQPVLSLTLFQPLLRNYGQNGLLADVQRGKASRTVAQLQRETTAATIVRDLVIAYWELAYAAEVTTIQQQSLDLAKEQLRVVEASVSAGRLARSATAEVEVTVAQRQADLLSAQRQVVVRGAALRRLAGLPPESTPVSLKASDPLAVSITKTELADSLEAAFEAAPQIKAIRAQGAAAKVDLEVSENGLLPQLDLNASAGPSGNAGTVGDAYDQLGKFKTFTVQGSLLFSTSIERNTAKGIRDVAAANVRRAAMTEADVKAQIAEQVAATVAFLDNFAQQIEVLDKAEGASKVNLESEQARFSVGRTTNYEVLRRQEELARVRLQQARARADYLAQKATLESLTGDILSRYAINVGALK